MARSLPLIIKPYSRGPTDRAVGYVVDSRTVLGEWQGRRWNKVPRKAALYCNDMRAMEPMYQRGECEKIWWQKKGRIKMLSGWKWWRETGDPIRIYFLHGALDKTAEPERLGAILDMVSFVREQGGGPSSTAGMLHSMFRANLPAPLYESALEMPAESIWRGSRVQRRDKAAHEYNMIDLWDMRSAFPSALRSVPVPRKWKRYGIAGGGYNPPLPQTEAAYIRAKVHVPWMMHGPLPDVGLHHPTFPTETWLRGVWSLDELKAAEAVGCTILIEEFWTGNHFSEPFRDWGNLVDELRGVMRPESIRLAKMAANQYVGRFAMDGYRMRSRMVGRQEAWIEEAGWKRPDSLTIHGLVTADVRTQLFTEGIYPYPVHFVFCHTDGVALMAESEAIGHPDDTKWTVKAYMEKLYLLTENRYAYRPGAEDFEPGDMRYVVAGIPEQVAEPFFHKRWERQRLKESGRLVDTDSTDREDGKDGKRGRTKEAPRGGLRRRTQFSSKPSRKPPERSGG